MHVACDPLSRSDLSPLDPVLFFTDATVSHLAGSDGIAHWPSLSSPLSPHNLILCLCVYCLEFLRSLSSISSVSLSPHYLLSSQLPTSTHDSTFMPLAVVQEWMVSFLSTVPIPCVAITAHTPVRCHRFQSAFSRHRAQSSLAPLEVSVNNLIIISPLLACCLVSLYSAIDTLRSL